MRRGPLWPAVRASVHDRSLLWAGLLDRCGCLESVHLRFARGQGRACPVVLIGGQRPGGRAPPASHAESSVWPWTSFSSQGEGRTMGKQEAAGTPGSRELDSSQDAGTAVGRGR